MKRNGKTLMSILLALAMTLALSVSAMAAPSDPCAVYFSDPFAGIALLDGGSTAPTPSYSGYQLMYLTTSLKSSTCHTDPSKHTDTCYNYGYELNPKYSSYLLAAAGITAATPANPAKDRDDLITYLNTASTDVQAFADAVYRALKTAGVAPDKTALAPNATWTIDQGYWLFADTTSYDGTTSTAKTPVLLATQGKTSLTVTPKTEVPTVEKKVSDTDGSGYGDTTDVSIGDTVYFKITGSLPEHLGSYAAYKYVFHDTMSKGLTFNDDVEVKVNGTADVTGSFTVTTAAAADGSTIITVSCADILDSTDGFADSITDPKTDKIVLTYSAKLNDDAVIGSTGNPNRVYLEYTNDPYAESTGKTTEDEVKVYTFQLNVTKTDSESHALAGAQFVLLSSDQAEVASVTGGKLDGWDAVADITVNADGTYPAANTMTSDSAGAFALAGLDAGTYYLKETKAPEGYNLLKNPIKLVISATYTGTSLNTLTIQTDDNTPINGLTSSGTVSITVVNNSGAQLPSTGGVGTTVFYVLGSALVLGAVVLLVTRKRMRDRA